MEGELAALMDMFHAVKRAGRSATLTLSTNSGKATQVKLAIELDDALLPPSTSSTSASAPAVLTPATGSRHHRGPAKKAKARARAVKHRAAQAAVASPTDPGGDEGAPPFQVPPPAQGLLQPQPSASPAPTRKLVTKLRRRANTWSTMPQLDGEGEESESNSEEIDNEDNIDLFSIYPTIDEVKPKVRRKVLHCAFCRIAPSSDDVSNSKVNVNCTQKGYIGICHGCCTYNCHDTNSLDT